MYIPPVNSIYFTEEYFSNLHLIIEYFRHCNIYIINDMNCRIGTPTSHLPDISYCDNPDTFINSHGCKILDLLSYYPEMAFINGLKF